MNNELPELPNETPKTLQQWRGKANAYEGLYKKEKEKTVKLQNIINNLQQLKANSPANTDDVDFLKNIIKYLIKEK